MVHGQGERTSRFERTETIEERSPLNGETCQADAAVPERHLSDVSLYRAAGGACSTLYH